MLGTVTPLIRGGKDQAWGELIDDGDGETNTASLCSAVEHSGTALKGKRCDVLGSSEPVTTDSKISDRTEGAKVQD